MEEPELSQKELDECLTISIDATRPKEIRDYALYLYKEGKGIIQKSEKKEKELIDALEKYYDEAYKLKNPNGYEWQKLKRQEGMYDDEDEDEDEEEYIQIKINPLGNLVNIKE